MHAPRQKHWIQRLLRSQYFVIAFFLHAVIFLMISGVVVFKAVFPANPGFDKGDYIPGDSNGSVAPPPPPSKAQQETQVQIPTQQPSSAPDVIASDLPNPDSFKVALPSLSTALPDIKNSAQQTMQQTMQQASTIGGLDTRRDSIKEFVKGWAPGGKGNGPVGSGKNIQAEFVCYVAQYADGDWAATVNGDLTQGSIPNLMRMINRWSKGKIKANVVGRALDLSSQEIFTKKPPFIFFNGHKDFHLTDREIENLRKYLIQGGAIWGDNALAGAGSRFDVAFRREMKRVIPDEDKPFKVIPQTHPIFNSYFEIRDLPEGMNYFKEPIEGIEMDGVLAVIYTLNDYGDLMQAVLDEKNKITFGMRYQAKMDIVTNKRFWRMGWYYRNFDDDSAVSAFQLGINITVHLLTRYQEALHLF